jgi:hypothetical protein
MVLSKVLLKTTSDRPHSMQLAQVSTESQFYESGFQQQYAPHIIVPRSGPQGMSTKASRDNPFCTAISKIHGTC